MNLIRELYYFYGAPNLRLEPEQPVHQFPQALVFSRGGGPNRK